MELLIATPSFVSIASLAGHMSLLFRLKNDPDNRSPVISFLADSVGRDGILQEGFPYVFNGIFGQYRTVLQEESLRQLTYRHNVIEGRDIYRLTLKLSQDQIRNLIHRIRIIREGPGEKFFFFNRNCTTLMVQLLNDILPEKDKIPDRESIDMPLVAGSRLVRRGLARLEETGYRWFSETPRLLRFHGTGKKRVNSIRSGYSLLRITPCAQMTEGTVTPSLSVKLATYHQSMGDKSIFSLGPETGLELFSFEGRYHWPEETNHIPDRQWDLDIKPVLFDRLIIPNSRRDVTLFNPGIGMELFSLSTDHQRGIQSDITPFHLTYHLNVLSFRQLTHFLNLGFGWGLSQQKYRDAVSGPAILHFTDFSGTVRGKVQLPGNRDNVIRLDSEYKARWARDLGLLSQWTTSLEIQWHIPSNHSIIMTAGIRHRFSRFHFGFPPYSENPENRISIYFSFNHFGNIFPTLGDVISLF